jgi:hypothetical protein
MIDTLLTTLTFPDRNRFKKVELVALYIEPRVGSGERICVGVVAVQEGAVEYAEVPNLKRLKCLYGSAHAGLIFAGQLALKSLRDHIVGHGFAATIQTWRPPADGLFLGCPVTTASSSLNDALSVSLGQFSSLYTEPDTAEDDEPTDDEGRMAAIGGWQLERLVKETILLLRPEFKGRFGQKRRIKDGARPMRLGYVGEKVIANFGLLTPKSLSAMVSNSKAKLWDLAQAREGTQTGWFSAEASTATFKLFVHHPRGVDAALTARQRQDIAEALEELETEADKLEVRCQAVASPTEIAKQLITLET